MAYTLPQDIYYPRRIGNLSLQVIRLLNSYAITRDEDFPSSFDDYVSSGSMLIYEMLKLMNNQNQRFHPNSSINLHTIRAVLKEERQKIPQGTYLLLEKIIGEGIDEFKESRRNF